MSILEKLNLDPKEEKLIVRVLAISSIMFVLFIATIGTLNFIKMRKIAAKTEKVPTQKSGVTEVDLKTFYETKKSELLPIDIEAHKIAALDGGNSTIKNRIEHLTRVVAARPNDTKTLIKLANIYIEAGLYDKSETLLEEVITNNPTIESDKKIAATYGLVLFYNGKYEKSHRYLEKLANSENPSKEALCYLGQIEAALNKATAKAEEYLLKSIAIDSEYTEASYQLARLYMNKPGADSSDYNKSRKLLLSIIEKEPLNTKAHSRLGMVYFYLEQPTLAERSYLTALSLNSSDFNTRYNLGELYFSEFENSKKALREFKQTIKLYKNHVNANFKIGIIMLENGQYKEAVRFLETAQKGDPENIRILFQQAVAFEKLDMKDRARQIYARILSLDKLNDIAQQKLRLLDGA